MKTHEIDGVTYIEVNRKAEVGDIIIIVSPESSADYYKNGSILTVSEADRWPTADPGEAVSVKEHHLAVYHREYRVLERRVPTLSELCAKCTPENRHEEVFVDTSQTSPAVIDMLANLARRVTSLESQLRDTQRNVETFAEQAESNSEDIRELDGRTQVLSAINKYYAEGSR
jgi:hypothetical protein